MMYEDDYLSGSSWSNPKRAPKSKAYQRGYMHGTPEAEEFLAEILDFVYFFGRRYHSGIGGKNA